MNEQLRIQKLKEIQEGEPYSTGIPLKYKGENLKANAYKIPLKYLTYNKYNGRIGTVVKSFEKQNHVINPEELKDISLIEKFLWDSKKDRNEKTAESLAKDKQQKYGIVSANGVIIDGNRRASLLNYVYSKKNGEWKNTDVDHAEYFIAIILPHDAGKKEIMELETRYQMGQDEKVDYNAEEKYLKCAELKTAGFSELQIADMMGEKESKIKEILSIFNLMEGYLNQYGYDGIYTRLNQREGQFVDLNGYLRSWTDNKAQADWDYDEFDVVDLKTIAFDYIRAQYEGKEFRAIGKTNRKNPDSFFAYKNVWDAFKKSHEDSIDTASSEEKSIDELRQEFPGEDLSKILSSRDKDWTNMVGDNLKQNLRHSTNKLEAKQESNEPIKLIVRAFDSLNAINEDVESFWKDDNVLETLKAINKLTYDFQKIIKTKRK